MPSGEVLWKSPEDTIYMIQGYKDTGKWEYASFYLYTLPEAIEFMKRQWGFSMLRVVKVSRYLPGKDMDPVPCEVMAVFTPES